MSSKNPVRNCDDVDQTALDYAEIKALCAGNPLIAEKINLDIEVAKLKMLKSDYLSTKHRLEDDLLKRFPMQISSTESRIAGIEKDVANYGVIRKKHTVKQENLTGEATDVFKFPGMEIGGQMYYEKDAAAKALLDSTKSFNKNSDVPIGEYCGFKMSLSYESMSQTLYVLLRGEMTYQIDLGTDGYGNITRINNTLDSLQKRLEGAKAQLENIHEQMESAQAEIDKPFDKETELKESEAHLMLLNAELNIDERSEIEQAAAPEPRNSGCITIVTPAPFYNEHYGAAVAYGKSEKTSILDSLAKRNAEPKQEVEKKSNKDEQEI